MRNKLRGFTLIELLVVIVIIGILATIGVATFQGYFVKSRDTQRQVTVRSIANVLKVDQIANGVAPNYALSISELRTSLANQGYVLPEAQQGIDYHYGYLSAAPNNEFFVFACKESEFTAANSGDNDAGPGSTYGFVDGTPAGIAAFTRGEAGDACSGGAAVSPSINGYTDFVLTP